MVRYVSSALILTVVLVVLLGRCHYSNMTVGMMGPAHNAVARIGDLKHAIDMHYYDHHQLPDSNLELRKPEPDQYGKQAALLQRLEVLPGGILYAQFAAENKGIPVELVYTPSTAGRHRLNWTCSSYNLTQALRDALWEPCGDAAAAFDREQALRPQELAQSADDYLQRVTAIQREKISNTPREPMDCSALQQAGNDFLHITARRIEYWSLQDDRQRRFALDRPQDNSSPAHWALNGNAYLYRNNRLQVFNADHPAGLLTPIHLLQPYRIRRDGSLLLANTGVGVTRIDLCRPEPAIKDTYLLELGAYHQIQDFVPANNLIYLTAQEPNRGLSHSALQIVSLRSNRPVGFLKLEGQSRGIAIAGRHIYVANGARGIAILDGFDPTMPRLQSRIATQDFASDLLLQGDYLLLADRLAGLKVYYRDGDSLALAQALPTAQAAIQIKRLTERYFAVSFKNGTTALYQWQDNKAAPIELSSP